MGGIRTCWNISQIVINRDAQRGDWLAKLYIFFANRHTGIGDILISIEKNLLALASIAFSENQRTVTSASDCSKRLTMLFNSLSFTDSALSSAWLNQ